MSSDPPPKHWDFPHERFHHQIPPSNSSTASDPSIARLRVDLFLRGLTVSENRSPSDVYCPTVRRSALDLRSTFEHVDTISTWRNLSIAQAEELCFWESAFQQSLEEVVAKILMDAFTEQEVGYKGPRDEHSILRRLFQYVSALEAKTIYVDMQQLIRFMLDLYYEDEIHQKHHWFVSSRNLSMAICNFLRTRDCFKESYPEPQVRISFSAKRVSADLRLDIFGDVMWFAPDVRPMGLPEIASPGSELRLVPQYLEHILEDQWSSYPVDSDYDILSKSKLSLTWDQSIQGFRGIVPGRNARNHRSSPTAPGYSKDQYAGRLDQLDIMEVALTVVLTKQFPENVRFELESRFKVRVRIAPSPYELRWLASYQNNSILGDSSDPSSFKRTLRTDDAQDRSRFRYERSVHEAREDTPQRVSSWVASFENTPVSKRGGLSSKDKAYIGTHHGVHKRSNDGSVRPIPGERDDSSTHKSGIPTPLFQVPSPKEFCEASQSCGEDTCELVTQPYYKDSDTDSDAPLQMATYQRGRGPIKSAKNSKRLPPKPSDRPLCISKQDLSETLRWKRHIRIDSKIQLEDHDSLPFYGITPNSKYREDEVPLMGDMGPGGEPTTPSEHLSIFEAEQTVNQKPFTFISSLLDSDSEESITVYNLGASPAVPSQLDVGYKPHHTSNYFGISPIPAALHRSKRIKAEPSSRLSSQLTFEALRIVSNQLFANYDCHTLAELLKNSKVADIGPDDSPPIESVELGSESKDENMQGVDPFTETNEARAREFNYIFGEKWVGNQRDTPPPESTDRAPICSGRIVTPQQSQIQANYETFLKQKQKESMPDVEEEDLAAWILETSEGSGSSQQWESAGLGDDDDDEDEVMREIDDY